MSKKVLVAMGLASALLIGVAALAEGQNTGSPSSSLNQLPKPPARMNLTIGPAGRASLTGTIVSLSTNSLVVKSWGGNWNVNLPTVAASLESSNSEHSNAPQNLANMLAGDWVIVKGKASTTAAWTIDAARVQDLSIKLRRANLSGVVSAATATAFTLTPENKPGVPITLAAGAIIMVDGQTKTAADIKDGMRASVMGMWDAGHTTVAANKVNARTPKPPATTSNLLRWQ